MNAGSFLKHIASNSLRSLGVLTVASTLALLSLPAAATLVVPASAQTITQSNGDLQATASFWVSGSQLMVNLANTSSSDVTAPVDILQAVYWDMASNVSLSLVSATTDQNCTFTSSGGSCGSGGTYTGTALNGTGGDDAKYAYNGDTSSAPTGKRGIGSAGLGNFGGTNGGDWGILSAGDNLSTYNGGLISNSPYVKNSVTFALDMTSNSKNGNLPSQVGDLNIKNLVFNYGTDYNPLVPPTLPEPAGLALFSLAAGLMMRSLRKRRNG